MKHKGHFWYVCFIQLFKRTIHLTLSKITGKKPHDTNYNTNIVYYILRSNAGRTPRPSIFSWILRPAMLQKKKGKKSPNLWQTMKSSKYGDIGFHGSSCWVLINLSVSLPYGRPMLLVFWRIWYVPHINRASGLE